ncbi:MAG: dihydromethanopterin reductase (acceptor) [Methanosarcinales archaeon Met12]|nr:MAG: dihydromethanopterin reductase (acceptor) [Methanosarcinales archaeon Met12]
MNIAWGITGAGHFLRESYEIFWTLAQEHQITTFVSGAGEEVLRMYGLFDKMSEISNGEYLREIFLESRSGKSFPKAGRFLLGKYDALIISPATSNTVAKVVHGISDSLITNAVTQTVKGGTPVYIVPVDISGTLMSEMPYFIDRDACEKCDDCPPKERCPKNAITDQIDLLKCDGCGLCVDCCPHSAIRGGFVKCRVRDIDAQNVETMRSMDGIAVLKNPNEILSLF